MKTHAQLKQNNAASAQAKAKNQAPQGSILQAYKKGTAQLQTMKEEEPVQGKFETAQLEELGEKEEEPAQRKENKTGLPDHLKSGVESLSGHSLDDVKVHFNSAKPAALQAHAYAQGTDIHVAPGQEKHLPHEAWHVVQQKQGRVKPTKQLMGKTPVNDDSGLETEADVMGAKAMQTLSENTQLQFKTPGKEVKQMVFNGPQFNQAGNHNGNYGGHAFNTGGVMNVTGCGTNNSITTAGERLAPGAASKPGTPTGMNLYRGGFSRGGGLVRDKNLNQASTKMHLINHRLENSGNTQRTAANIFLGTQKSNNPTHLNQVETPVINAVTNHASRNNNRYETAMNNAQSLQHANGQAVLYWANNVLPHATAVNPNHLRDAYIDLNGDVADPVGAGGNSKKKMKIANTTGKYILTNNYNGFKHLWLTYSVTPNYNAVPGHIQNNILVETNFAQTKKQKQQNMLMGKINTFTNNFAPNAFPSTFDNDVTYYYASYDPNNRYASEQENHTINADL
ncbi:DUF4157 domain-containing protein [Fluviicola sp.]|uniref:eCIS core domain-containing protein n=1 Tax=Fluviicola sp. TaxID=1917219 RepID=UPI0031DAB9A9